MHKTGFARHINTYIYLTRLFRYSVTKLANSVLGPYNTDMRSYGLFSSFLTGAMDTNVGYFNTEIKKCNGTLPNWKYINFHAHILPD